MAEGTTFDADGERFTISYLGNSGKDVTLTAVGRAPIVTLTDNPNATLVGNSVVFTATVASSNGSGATPTGTVTFTDITNAGAPVALGTVTLVRGKASLTIDSLAAGTHRIVATYNGDGNYLATTSATLSILSSKKGPIITAFPVALVDTAKTVILKVQALDTTLELDNLLKYTWTLVKMPSGAKTPLFSLNGGHGALTTTASFTKDGTYHFRVTVTDNIGNSTSADVDYVVTQKPRILRLAPHNATVKKGEQLQFSAIALDQFAHPMRTNVGNASWTVIQGTGSIISTTGLYTAGQKAGPVTIEALLGGVVGEIVTTIV